MLRLTTGCGVALCAIACLMMACSEGAAVPSPSGSAGQAASGASAGGAAGAVAAAGAPSVAGSEAPGGATGAAGAPGGSAGATTAGQAGSGGAANLDPNAPEPSPGCGSADAPPDGTTPLQVADLARSYVLRKPTNYAATKPWPLLLALHPNGSDSSYWDGTSGARAFRPLVAEAALLVAPQARDNDWRGDVPLDLEYFDELLKKLEAELCVDLKRITAVGFSGGGSFAGALACYRQDIRAIAVGGAVSYFEEQDCVGKAAAWITIGDDEAIQGRLDFRDYFRTSAGCAATGTTAEPATCTAYDCPSPDRPVQFCSHPGGHVWPDFGTAAAWAFVSQF